jgi:polygalacturonase
MPTPTSINDLSTSPSANYPAGTESPIVLDDVQRAHAAFIAQLRDRETAQDLRTDLAASGGADLIGFGSGTVGAALRGIVSVKNLGAVGDGIVDDTDAFEQALSLGGYIFIPKGRYKISRTLNVKGNSNIFGAGIGITVLIWAGLPSGNIIQDTSRVNISDINQNISLTDFELDGNSYASGSTFGINFYRVKNVLLENLYVHHVGASLINFGFSQLDTKNVLVRNCLVEFARQGDGIQGVGTDIVIDSCKAFSCGDTCFATLYDFSPITNSAKAIPQDISFINCIAKGEWMDGSYTGSGNPSQLGFAIGPYGVGRRVNCTIVNCTTQNLYMNVWMVVFSGIKLTGNTFNRHGNLLTAGVRFDGVEDITFSDNFSEVFYSSSNTYYGAILLNAQRNVYGASTFDAPMKRVIFSNNRVTCYPSSAAAIVIYVDPQHSQASDILISGNVFSGSQAPIKFLPSDGSGLAVFNSIEIANNISDQSSGEFVMALGNAAQYEEVRLSNNLHGQVPISLGVVSNFQISGGFLRKLSVVDNVSTEIYLMSGQQTVQIEAYVEAGNSSFSAVGVFVTNFGTSRIAWKSDGGNCVLTLVGNSVRVRQSGIGNQTVTVRIKYLS